MELFVFPLEGMVLFPTSVIPLNIFEPRYVEMVNDSFARGVPIALAAESPAEDEDLSGRDWIVGYGHPTLLEKRPDGTMLILLRGAGKARLTAVSRAEPYIVCQAAPIEESGEVEEPNLFALNRCRKRLEGWVRTHISSPGQQEAMLRALDSPQKVLDSLGLYVVKDPDLRQELLETQDINERIRLMTRITEGGP
jgi:Lon protease-like protein